MGLVKTTRANKEAVSDPKLHLALTAVGQKSIDCNENSNMNIEQHRRRGNNIWTITATQQPKGTKLFLLRVHQNEGGYDNNFSRRQCCKS